MKLSPNFTVAEAGQPPPEFHENAREVARRLEIIRAAADSPLWVSSWYRSVQVKRLVDDAATLSTHTTARAADFVAVRGRYTEPMDMQELVEALIRAGAIPDGGLGRYDRHTHYDIGRGGRRWSGISS